MATDDGLPFRVELPEVQYLVLLKHALNRSRAAARLAAAVVHEGKGKKSDYLVSGFVTDGLALSAIALVHAPEALPAIEREEAGPREVAHARRMFCNAGFAEPCELFLHGSGARGEDAGVWSSLGALMIRVGQTIIRLLAIAAMAVTAYFLSV
jgi:hypothetical protein